MLDRTIMNSVSSGPPPSPPKPMTQANVLVAGVARNTGPRAARTLERLRQSCTGFGSARAMVVESDSDDETVGLLQHYFTRQPWGEVISLGRLRDQMPSRTERIAHCRNYYLQALDNDAQLSDIHYLLVADLDHVNRHITRAALQTCWQLNIDWAAATGNQLGRYYDVWALRHSVWCPGDCWEHYRALRTFASDADALQTAVKSRQLTVDEHATAFETESSFGCLALYRREAVRGLRYVGKVQSATGEWQEVCEHVSLNEQLRARGYRVVLNPRLITRVRVRNWKTLRRAWWCWRHPAWPLGDSTSGGGPTS